MATRLGMAGIITKMRVLIQDTDSELSDETIQTILDEHKQTITHSVLVPVNRVDGGYTAAQMIGKVWEGANSPTDNTSVKIVYERDGMTGVTPLDINLDTGFVTFDNPQYQRLCVSRGYTFDVYNAATHLLEIFIARLKQEYTFSTSEGSFQRIQRVETLEKLARMYKDKSSLMPTPNGEDCYAENAFERQLY